MRRSRFAVLVTILVGIGAASSPASALAVWQRPVAGRVERPFVAPAFRYGPGHLGVDLAAPPGTPVHAAGAGIVVFAGIVAGTMHVVVGHDTDIQGRRLRTSYSFLASIRVHVGDDVALGAVIGTTGGRGEQHDGSVLHFGLRVGDTYVDPMQLLAPPDLGAVVHLAPIGVDRPGAPLRELRLPPVPPARAPTLPSPLPSGFPVLSGRRNAAGAPLYPR